MDNVTTELGQSNEIELLEDESAELGKSNKIE